MNAVPKGFASTRMYLERPAWERLADARAAAPVYEDAPAPHARRMSTGSAPADGPGGSTPQRQSFASFLQRQEEIAARRAADVAAAKADEARAYAHAPRIAPASAKILARSGASEASFSARNESHTRRRDLSRTLAAAPADAEATFQPVISRKAQARAPRSVDDMSAGDRHRREAERVAVREAVLRDELATATFKPQLSSRARTAEGRLRVAAEAESYVERVHQRDVAREERSLEQQLRRAEAELQACTFHPEVHDAPAFVRRIASSRALAKSLRQSPEPVRPAWQ